MKKITIHQAISSLLPGAEFAIRDNDYDQIEWWDKVYKQPSKEEVNQEIERIQQEYENNQYQRDRKKEYPPIEDQLDILYHQGYDGWKAIIDEVKNKYPKPQ